MINYIQLAKLTDVPDYDVIIDRLTSANPKIIHAMLGIASESGEVVDAIKKHIIYGKSLDETNLKEEFGDLLWYLAILAEALNTTFEIEMQRNIEKLRTRYPNKFNSEDAINRNLDEERKVLER